jgi:hypothetical protein
MTKLTTPASNENNPSPARRSNSPIAALSKLDAYMVLAGYDGDHPWRTEIARALVAPAPTDATFHHAIDTVDAANLAVEIIGDLETFLCTIDALAKSDDPTEEQVRVQLCSIQKIARLAVHFASDRSEHYGFVRDDVTKALAVLKAAA